VELIDSFLRLSLLCQRPAAQDSTARHEVRKSLFCGEDNGGFGVFLGGTPVPAEFMESGSTAQGKDQAKRVRTLLR